MAERASGSRWKLWLLLQADRHALATGILAGCFLALVGLSQVAPTSLRATMTDSYPVETTFQALVTAIITGVTLVVTITQLVLSQEQGPLGDQRNRMEGTMEYLDDVESVLDRSVSPSDPSTLLSAILEGIRDSARSLTEGTDAVTDPEMGEDLEAYADRVADDAETAMAQLEGAEFGTYDVLDAALEFNYSEKIYDGRRIRATHDDLPDEVSGSLSNVLEGLKFYAPAREHVKTLYFQWDLMNLSRVILYASVPALVVSVAMILYANDPSVVTGSTLSVDNLVWLVAAAVTVALTPFVILLSYILRIVTVAKRTLAIGPLVLRERDESNDGS